MSNRSKEIEAFLSDAGLDGIELRPLAGDASNRRYLRLTDPQKRPLVLMDAPPEKGEDVRPFIAVTHWLREQGFSAPRIFARDAENGFSLLEDLGDDLFANILAAGKASEAELYATAIDLLAELATRPVPRSLNPKGLDHLLMPYDLGVLLREASLFTEWYLPTATMMSVTADFSAEFRALVAATVDPVSTNSQVIVLRDYHAENLIWLPGRTGHARVGLLDYQDALAGHPAYDVVSLLEDARRDTSADLRSTMINRYIAARNLSNSEAQDFRAAYAILGAQRNLKIVGIFARLAIRDGKPRYLDLIPRVWQHLEHDLAHPDLVGLRRWVSSNAPTPTSETLRRLAAAPQQPAAAPE